MSIHRARYVPQNVRYRGAPSSCGRLKTIADIRGLSTVVSAAEVHRCPAFGHPAARATAQIGP